MNRKQSATRNQPKATQQAGLKRSKPAPLALEARLMFDGAAVATAVADAAPAPDAPVVDHAAETHAPAAAQTEAAREGAQAADHAPVKEIVFIDPSVSNWQLLAAGVNPDAEVVMLDPARDGLAQMAEALQGKSGLEAIHIVSHGSDGGIVLGGTTYGADALAQHQADLAAIGGALTQSGDLLIYGCDVAQGSVGEAFVNAVAAATQADVAASKDATGSAAQGGNWQLEYASGAIEADVFAKQSSLDNYDGLLKPAPSPTIDLDTTKPDNPNGISYSTIYVEGKQAVPVVNIDHWEITIPGSQTIYSITVKLVEQKSGDILSLDTSNPALTGIVDKFKIEKSTKNEETLIRLTKADNANPTVDDYKAVIEAIRFETTNKGPDTGSDAAGRTVSIEVTDNSRNHVSVKAETTIKVDHAPVANPDTGKVNENEKLEVVAGNGVILGKVAGKDTDVDNATKDLRVAGVVAGNKTVTNGSGVGTWIEGSYGRLTLNADGSYTYEANKADALAQGAKAQDVFSYTVKDPDGATSKATTLTITVTGTNDAPTSTDAKVSTPEDTSIILSMANFGNFKDVDGEVTSVKITTLENNGRLEYRGAGDHWVPVVLNQVIGKTEIETGSLRFVPDADENGTPYATIGFKVGDGTDFSAKAYTLTINVEAVNDAPVAKNNYYPAIEDVPLEGMNVITDREFILGPKDYDIDSSVLSIASVKINGTETAFGSLADGSGAFAGWKVLALTNGTAYLKADGSLRYQTAQDNTTGDSFSYKITDGALTSEFAKVEIGVVPVNDAPVANADTATVTEDGSVTINVLANDKPGPDNESSQKLTVTAAKALHGTVVINKDGTLSYTPNADYNGDDTISYTIRDNGKTFGFPDAKTASATVAVTVTAVNDAPVATNDIAKVAEDGSVTIDVLTNDKSGPGNESGQTLTVTEAKALHGTVVINKDGTLSYTPDADYNGDDVISYTIQDDGTTNGLSDAKTAGATVAVTVTAVNDVPVAANDTAKVAEDGSVTIDVLTNDKSGPGNESGQTLTVTEAKALHGTVVINKDGTLSYTPDANYNGDDTISYTIQDDGTTNGLPDAKTASATVAVTVTAVNNAPVATNDSAKVAEDGSVTIDVLTNDKSGPDNESGQTLTVTEAKALHGTVVINKDGTLSYTPDTDYYGDDIISYTIQDDGTTNGLPDAKTASATVAVTVTPVNDAPIVGNVEATAVESGDNVAGTNPTGNVLGSNVSDIDNKDAPTVTEVAFGDVKKGEIGKPLVGAYGALTLNADGSYTYILDNNNADVQALRGPTDRLTETFTFKVTDSGGATSKAATFTITIVGSNDAPVVNEPIAPQTLIAGNAYDFQLPATLFKDVDKGDTLTYTAKLSNGDPLPAWLIFDDKTQRFSGVANNSDVGTLAVEITVTDSAGATAKTTYNLEVVGNSNALALLNTNQNPTLDAQAGGFTGTGYNPINPGRTYGYIGDGLPPDPTGVGNSTGPGRDPNVLISQNPPAAGPQFTDTSVAERFELAAVDLNGQRDDFVVFAPPGVKMVFQLPSYIVEGSAPASFAAVQMNGDELPNWLSFDPLTGKFLGKAPKDMVGSVRIQLTGKDGQGNERSLRITLTIDPSVDSVKEGAVPNQNARIEVDGAAKLADKSAQRGRAGLSDQMKVAGKGSVAAERSVKLAATRGRSV